MAAVDADARCALHPASQAVDTCSRCGNYICNDCMELEDFDAFCADCFPKVSKKSPHSTRATMALVCGLLSATAFCLVLSPAAVILGHLELAAINRGESPHSGRNLAMGGLILGYIGIAMSVIFGGIMLLAVLGAAAR